MPRTATPAADPSAARGGRRIQVRRSGVHGKGVFAVQDIAEGEVLIEYTGEIISWQEAQDRQDALRRCRRCGTKDWLPRACASGGLPAGWRGIAAAPGCRGAGPRRRPAPMPWHAVRSGRTRERRWGSWMLAKSAAPQRRFAMPDARRRIHSVLPNRHAADAMRSGGRAAEAAPMGPGFGACQPAETRRNTSRAAATVSSMSCALWALLTKPAS
ncbi:SET domain-containing protein-lysine N-methyltransferase [Paracidovorax oryzae]|uniref:SET domain-containing protein-lysine N-methyltransferase n=1 Tax=Paracidovorax oryzae TaxID=862720 RepID=UPI00336ACB12